MAKYTVINKIYTRGKFFGLEFSQAVVEGEFVGVAYTDDDALVETLEGADYVEVIKADDDALVETLEGAALPVKVKSKAK